MIALRGYQIILVERGKGKMKKIPQILTALLLGSAFAGGVFAEEHRLNTPSAEYELE